MNWYKEQQKKSRKKHGAGILFCSCGKILLGLRSNLVGNPGTWSVPGGKISKKDKGYWDTAARETHEELGFFPSIFSKKSVIRNKDVEGREYVTYILDVEADFVKQTETDFEPNDEFDRLEWFDLDSLPNNIHPKTKLVLDKYRSTHD